MQGPYTGPNTEKDVVQTPWCPRSNRALVRQFSAGTDKILFSLMPMPRNGARVLPLEVAPVLGHGAQIFAKSLIKSYVQTGARARLQRAATAWKGLSNRPFNNIVMSQDGRAV